MLRADFGSTRTKLTRNPMALSFAVAFAIVTSAQAQNPERELRAGSATRNITPPLGSSINGGMSDRKATHIHDELHARCLVLDDGSTRLAFAVCDMCMIPRPVMDQAKEYLRNEVGLS